MRSIFKQSSYLFLAQGFARGIGFFYNIFLAGSLGVAGFGLFGAALAFYSLAATIAEFGFNRFLIRQVALEADNASSLVWTVAILRFAIAAIILVVSAVLLSIFDPDKLRTEISLLAILAIIPTTLAQTLDSIFVGLSKLQYSAAAVLLTSLFTIALGIILISMGLGIFGASLALIFGQLFYLICLFVFLKRQRILKFLSLKSIFLKEALIGSLPYGILGVLGLLYFRIDTLMLSYLKGNFDTGIYTAAYKFLEASILIPSSVSSAIFPLMAKFHDLGNQKLKSVYYKSVISLGLVSLLVILGFQIILPIIIKIFLPNYLLSIQVIRILSIAIPFIYLAAPGIQVMLSTSKYLKEIILFSVFNLLFNVLLNILLIPQFTYIGAAWATVISEALSFVLFFIFIRYKILRDF